MSMLRATGVRAEKNARSPRRAGIASVPGAAAWIASGSPPARPRLNSFVTRCVRTWIAAGASATDFLVTWTPLRFPEPFFGGSALPDPSRRRPSATRRSARRAAHYPAPSSATATLLGPAAAAGGADELRARYPLVSALLVELATPRRRRTVTDRSVRR
jgi:hypothetical protein